MKKHLVLGALAVLSLAACTKSEVVELNKGNEISLTAVTGKNLTKAADGYCNTVKPKDFYVWAATDGKKYFEEQKYYLPSGEDTYKAEGAARYWPASAVDFFALKNYEGASASGSTQTLTPTAGSTQLEVTGYQVESDVADQKDFLYAVSKNVSKPVPAAASPLNFRHALSQIEFKAKNDNKNIYVYIDGVSVVNVYNTGTFTVTDETTDNWLDHDLDDTDADTRTYSGEWTAQTGNATYSVEFASSIPVPTGSAVKLTNTTSKHYSDYSMYLLPQGLNNVWGGKAADGAPQTSGKTYFVVSALIYNVADPTVTFNPDHNVVLWGDNSTGTYKPKDIAVQLPTGMVWEDGLRYVYTFNFTSYGMGGSDPSSGDPVLTPITLTVSVDDFVDAGNEDVEVK